MAEVQFEVLALALEATRGTPIAAPTNKVNGRGTLMPKNEKYRPDDAVGDLSDIHRSEVTRTWGEFDGTGALDIWTAPLLLNMAIAPVTVPTTPASAVLSRLWTFTRVMTADTIKAATMFFGDPNQRVYVGAYGMLDELTFGGDATGTDGSTMGFKGHTQTVTDGAAPAIPATALSPLIIPGRMQVYIDTSSAIGTTAVTGRVLSANHTFPTGVTYKYPATGPAGTVTYSRTGRVGTHPETRIVLDMVDQTQYDLFKAFTYVKVRVRHNGPLIESVAGPLDFYNYIEVDCYGKFDMNSWGEYEGNRTIELVILHEMNTTAGTDAIVRVQNTRTTL